MQNNALLAYFQRNLVTLRSKTASTSLPFRQRAEPKGPSAFKVHKIESEHSGYAKYNRYPHIPQDTLCRNGYRERSKGNEHPCPPDGRTTQQSGTYP